MNGWEAFQEALHSAKVTQAEISGSAEFAGVVYSFYHALLADDDVNDPWSEEKVKKRAVMEYLE